MSTTTKSTHTPGPWTIRDYVNYEGFSINGPDGTGCIAERWFPTLSDLPIKANARLIACAPELLDALEELIDRLEDVIDIGKPELLGKSYAVIRKARGL